MPMMLRDLAREEIDEARWNRLTARHGLPYGQTWWLDQVAREWRALVKGDYEAVLPYPVKRVGPLRYIMQPVFTQQLGVFGTVTPEEQEAMFKRLPHVCFVLQTNEWNVASSYARQERRNRILPLRDDYETLRRAYSENTRRNCAKAYEASLVVEEAHDKERQEACLDFLFANNPHLDPTLDSDAARLSRDLTSHDRAKWIVAWLDDRMMSVVLLVDSGEGRLVYLLAATSEEGKRRRASFAIVDWIVRRYAHSDRELDFEGSMVVGVDRFYEGFGALARTYYEVARCHPRILVLAARWIRKFLRG